MGAIREFNTRNFIKEKFLQPFNVAAKILINKKKYILLNVMIRK